MCDGCQGEVHLQKMCSGVRRKPADDTPFYCSGCAARRDRQARAVAAAEEAAAAAAEVEGVEDGGDGSGGRDSGGKEGAKDGGGGEKAAAAVAAPAAPAKKVTPRMEFCEDGEDEQRRKKNESALKVCV